MVAARDWGSKIRASYAKLTFTAAGFTTASAGDIGLIHMPPGKVRILAEFSRVQCPAGTATSDLDIGLSAYKGNDGVTVVADADRLLASFDIGGGALDATLSSLVGEYLEIESQDGFDIVCSFDTADSPAAGDLVILIMYQIGN